MPTRLPVVFALHFAAVSGLAPAITKAGLGADLNEANQVGDLEARTEYKISLARIPLSDQDRIFLWRALFDRPAPSLPADEEIDRKNCRRIEFLDTDDNALFESDLILRRRTPLGDKRCREHGDEEPGVVLKYRSEELDAARSQLGREPFGGDAELERDVQLGMVNGHVAQRIAISVARGGHGSELPNLGVARESFPSLLDGSLGDTALEPTCRDIFEQRWNLSADESPVVELAVWHTRSAGELTPAFAELSFRLEPPGSCRSCGRLR